MTDASGLAVSRDLSAFSPDLRLVLVNTASGLVAPGQVNNLISSPSTSNSELSLRGPFHPIMEPL